VRSHGGPWLWDDGVAVATEGLRVDPGRRVPAVDDGRREVKAKRRWGARARVVWAAKRGGGRLVHREGGVCSGGRAGVTMATGTYPMGSAHPYPYPLGLNFTRRVTRECTRVGK
jgi:hypothetical protein